MVDLFLFSLLIMKLYYQQSDYNQRSVKADLYNGCEDSLMSERESLLFKYINNHLFF